MSIECHSDIGAYRCGYGILYAHESVKIFVSKICVNVQPNKYNVDLEKNS